MDREKIGNFLTELRKEKNMSQSDAAELLNITPQAISKWERGECLPDISTLQAISSLYGVTSDEILAGERNKEKRETHLSSNDGDKKPYYFGAFWGTGFFLGIMILMLFPIVLIPYDSNIYINANLFNIISSPSYAYGNYFYLLLLFLFLAILGVSIPLFSKVSYKARFRLTLTNKILMSLVCLVYLLAVFTTTGEYRQCQQGTVGVILGYLLPIHTIAIWVLSQYRFKTLK